MFIWSSKLGQNQGRSSAYLSLGGRRRDRGDLEEGVEANLGARVARLDNLLHSVSHAVLAVEW